MKSRSRVLFLSVLVLLFAVAVPFALWYFPATRGGTPGFERLPYDLKYWALDATEIREHPEYWKAGGNSRIWEEAIRLAEFNDLSAEDLTFVEYDESIGSGDWLSRMTLHTTKSNTELKELRRKNASSRNPEGGEIPDSRLFQALHANLVGDHGLHPTERSGFDATGRVAGQEDWFSFVKPFLPKDGDVFVSTVDGALVMQCHSRRTHRIRWIVMGEHGSDIDEWADKAPSVPGIKLLRRHRHVGHLEAEWELPPPR